jgi:CheY-like chemotaxis protein
MSKLKQERIVIYVDDDLEDIDLVRDTLKSYTNEIELITFTNAFELLKCIGTPGKDRIFPCLIILDINMPKLDGKETLKLLREIEGYCDIPVVLFSTSMQPSDSEFASKYSADLMTKPLTERQMDCIVKRILNHCGNKLKNTNF